MPDPRGDADPGPTGADVPVDVEPAVDEIFELMPEETPEDVIELADRDAPAEVTEESVFEDLAEELSTPSRNDADGPETTLDVPAIDELFGEH